MLPREKGRRSDASRPRAPLVAHTELATARGLLDPSFRLLTFTKMIGKLPNINCIYHFDVDTVLKLFKNLKAMVLYHTLGTCSRLFMTAS